MKLIAQVKLLPTDEQADSLKRTIETANLACEFVGKRAWNTRTFGQYALHHLCYREVRNRFALSAQVTVRLIAKVADAYKLDRKVRRKFKRMGSVSYDDRILSWRMAESTVSIWTVEGRQRIPFVCGDHQRQLLATRQGETDLVMFRDKFFLSATCEVEEPEAIDIEAILGIDLGITNIAVDSDGETHSSRAVNNVRYRYRRLRQKLQCTGTHAAGRLLKALSGREARFARWTNHNISKSIVAKAQGTRRGIALEDLTGIRSRVRFRRPQRVTLHSWSFFQLRSFLEYKARRVGIPVFYVDPAFTSQTCPECGHVDKRNRRNQSTFSCVACGFSGVADHIAAVNISRRAVVNRPDFPRLPIHRQEWQGKALPLHLSRCPSG